VSQRNLGAAVVAAGLLLAAFQVPAAGEDVPAPLLACAAESDDTRRLACFDQALARMRGGGDRPGMPTAAPEATPAATPAVAAGAAPAAIPPGAAPRVVSQEEGFGLRSDQREEKLDELSEIVATVTDVRAKPHGELIVTLANQQVWAEIAPGSKIKLKPGDTVKIEAGTLRSFVLVAPNGRSSKVSRIR
jgi:hypothetical protein